MKIFPLGVGCANTQKYYHSNLLLDFSGTKLLVDAGTTLRYSLDKFDVKYDSIQYVFITHFHHDHVGGLVEFLTACYWRFIDGKHVPYRPTLLFRPNQIHELDGILSPALNNQGLTWNDYCLPIEILNDIYHFQNAMLKVIPTDSLHCEGLTSCGLIISESETGKNLILSGDIKKLSESNLISEVNDMTYAIIQDVSFKDSPVHSTYCEVLHYYRPNMHKKIYGIHYEDDTNLNDEYSIHLLEQGRLLSFSNITLQP